MDIQLLFLLLPFEAICSQCPVFRCSPGPDYVFSFSYVGQPPPDASLLCSLSLLDSARSVSPMYSALQSLHFSWYTTPAFSMAVSLSLRATKMLRMVVCGLECTTMPDVVEVCFELVNTFRLDHSCRVINISSPKLW